MSHNCGHHHHHAGLKGLGWVLLISVIYMGVEFIGGIMSHSLALLADSGHMLIDVSALLLAIGAEWLARKPANSQKTYGYYRFEILAAFINGLILVAIAIFVIWQACQRLTSPQVIAGPLMFWVALGGLGINLLSVWVLSRQSQDNLNLRGAMLHVLSDALGSVIAILASLAVIYGHWMSADSILSFILAGLILYNAAQLVLEAADILLESSPAHLNVAEIQTSLEALAPVLGVHDLHVWRIASGKDALSAHLMLRSKEDYQPDTLALAQDLLKSKFNLTHVTLQLEPPGYQEHDLSY
jgi:cobalt-zinc-cadmium efflux system protein